MANPQRHAGLELQHPRGLADKDRESERVRCSAQGFQHHRLSSVYRIAQTEGGIEMETGIEELPVIGTTAMCDLEPYLEESDPAAADRIRVARARLGKRVVVLGHHYQRDEVIAFADVTGDSYKLAQAATRTEAEFIVFCGVHFMAESADVLARRDTAGNALQQVILPDLNAGCSMADMAEITQVEACWEQLERAGVTRGLIPLTYMNSTAAIKAFCGERGGLVCTSSNAQRAFAWAMERGERILFLPDQHLGRNTGMTMGLEPREMPVWDPWLPQGGLTGDALQQARILLWKGHCSVHQRFLPQQVDQVRERHAGIRVIVHPECRWEVCRKADAVGSTEQLIRMVEEAEAGSSFAIGTEIHLVNRLAARFRQQGKRVMTLDETGCLCTTMYRISPQHLAWSLENLVEGRVVNRITVPAGVRHWARVALDRMLEVG